MFHLGNRGSTRVKIEKNCICLAKIPLVTDFTLQPSDVENIPRNKSFNIYHNLKNLSKIKSEAITRKTVNLVKVLKIKSCTFHMLAFYLLAIFLIS